VGKVYKFGPYKFVGIYDGRMEVQTDGRTDGKLIYRIESH
jgi:hypothetical protein